MKEIYVQENDFGWTWYYSPWIRRSVMATENGIEYVYAISDVGIRVGRIDSLSAPLKTVVFPRPNRNNSR